MQRFFKKFSVAILCFFVFIPFSFSFAASASTSQDISVTVDNPLYTPGKPTIVRSQNIANTTLDIVVDVDSSFANTSTDFVVTITNTFTGTVTTANYTQTPDTHAQSVLALSNLEPGTEYDITVRYSATGVNIFSPDSDVHTTVTHIDSPVLDSIDAITEDSADLHIIVDPAFIGSQMDFIVEVSDGGSYTVQATEAITNTTITLHIDGLDADTDYTFKVKYARKDTSHYSAYSNERSITTEGALNAPTIDEIRNITTSSADLVVKVDDYTNEKLDFVVRVTNTATGETFTVDFTETVDGDGKTILSIGGLDANTVYTFKVKYAREGDNDYSDYSSSKSARTGSIGGDEGGEVILPPTGGGTTKPDDTVSGGSTNVSEDQETEKQERKDALREKIIPEEKKEAYQTASMVGAAAGTAIALAGAIAPIVATMPGALGSSIFLKFLELFGIIGRRKEEKNWGIVFDYKTHLPIPAARIVLLDYMGKELATTYSDRDGRFGFLANPGTYIIQVFKKNFKLVTDIARDELYGDVYDGKSIEIKDNQIVMANIAMESEVIDWQTYANKRAKQYKWSIFMKYLFGAIYVIGFAATIVITYFYPNVFNFVVLSIYIFLIIWRIFFKKKRYGSIKTSDGKPVPFAVVNIYDKNAETKKGFAVTDAIGRYYLLTENGSYDLKAKGQPISGVQFEKEHDVHVRDGIVRKDVVV